MHISRRAIACLLTLQTAWAFTPALSSRLLSRSEVRGSRRGLDPRYGPRTLTAQLPHDVPVLLSQAATSSQVLRYFFAGGMCCGLSSGATVPIDVVKTRMQTDPRLQQLSVGDSARYILEQEGMQALFTGFGSTLVGFTINGAVKYGLYEVFKPAAGDILPQSPQIVVFMLAAAVAELFASTLLCPLEATRIRLVTEPSYGQEVFDALPRLVNEEAS